MDNIKKIVMILLFYCFRLFKIRDNKIVICSYAGQGYGDNGKYIAEEILKRKLKYDIVWLAKNTTEEFPKGIRAVKYNSIQSVYEQATAKLWIDNRRKPIFVRKRKKQTYIMTWHAGLGLKRVEGDAIEALSPNYIKAAKNDSLMADLFLSDSKWTTNYYRKFFWYDGEIMESGLPREDILFDTNNKIRSTILSKFKINDNTHVILYAPTFRKSQNLNELALYSLNWNKLLEALERRFGGDWVGMIRLHPNIAEQAEHLQLPSNIMNVSYYPDMQELLAASDVLVTDYSSCMFDFGAAHKPVFLFARDVDSYLKDRNFCFNFKDLPFNMAENEASLIHNISTYKDKDYLEKLTFFYKKCGYFKAGNASEKVVDYIIDQMG